MPEYGDQSRPSQNVTSGIISVGWKRPAAAAFLHIDCSPGVPAAQSAEYTCPPNCGAPATCPQNSASAAHVDETQPAGVIITTAGRAVDGWPGPPGAMKVS